jgi:hypothetical protein
MRLHGASYYICDDPNDSAPLDGNIPMKISFSFLKRLTLFFRGVKSNGT